MIPRARRFSPQIMPQLRRTAQNRFEAAAELVRLEFERERLLDELKGLAERMRRAESRREQVEARARALHELLAIAPAEGPSQPATLRLQIQGSTVSVAPPAAPSRIQPKVPHANDRNRRQGA
jgi:hypothetical protein